MNYIYQFIFWSAVLKGRVFNYLKLPTFASWAVAVADWASERIK